MSVKDGKGKESITAGQNGALRKHNDTSSGVSTSNLLIIHAIVISALTLLYSFPLINNLCAQMTRREKSVIP